MDQKILKQVSQEENFPESKVAKAINLIKEAGNTVPFVARYRKNETGNLSEDELRSIVERWDYLVNLQDRKAEIIATLEKREKLTPELKEAIQKSETMQELEELYKPYKQKKKTRGMKAKEKGLEPLANKLRQGELKTEAEAESTASDFIDDEQGVNSTDEALQGAQDIIAEQISETVDNRRDVKEIAAPETYLETQLKDQAQDENKVYQDYYDYRENLKKMPLHRAMAINRGEKEGVLKVSLSSPEERIIDKVALRELVSLENAGFSRELVFEAVKDACKRLIIPSIQRELRTSKTEQAEEHAIKIFSQNLERLLMQPPIKGKNVMGIDPAYKSGCKIAVVDYKGDMQEVDVIYPTPPFNKTEQAAKKVISLLNKYQVEIIAIGNGTASRETEEFVSETIEDVELSLEVQYAIVSEDGASVYSASKLAAEEFPELDVQERSAISIARRVIDPLAELVKIDPKSIGVGQYQHDVPQSKLKEAVQFVVEKVVNQVGVDVNTASVHLLRYISGLNKKSAENMVNTRSELGGFDSRAQLTEVKGLGAKTFEQCAGFLRILDGSNPLDKTAIHPESYHIAEGIIAHLNEVPENIGSEALRTGVDSLLNNKNQIQSLCQEFDTDKYTLEDILTGLKKPLYDPREEFDKPRLKKDVMKLEDLSEGMILEGEIRNVVDFGAFVDLGIKEDGLIHISNLSEKFVKHPMEIVSVGDVVQVEIVSIDKDRGRIGLKKV
ncbi:Tex family protein [Natranaerobius thermophilus]|uniref:RNA binding S1 domain protein n=1 Tax=Natranaerobius thermophilus (strain ATCC BAA-1301 / DSM 18059 / JW/NM-WN-LF) TaxID=457570 RepID=B2A6S4_NATTJ|nr:Tex family protein [Natranaerobius thermophilus]ACB84205.1 RNA binding S1 domain protein [Natranaerobius thermophilus JW/NM-WN-LF]